MNGHYLQKLISRGLSFVLLLTLLMASLMTSAPAEGTGGLSVDIRLIDCLSSFQTLYNSKDLKAIEGAFDTDLVDAYHATAAYLGISEADLGDSDLLFVSWIFPLRSVQTAADLPTCELSASGNVGDSQKGKLTANVILTYADGAREQYTAGFQYRMNGDNDWVLTAMPENTASSLPFVESVGEQTSEQQVTVTTAPAIQQETTVQIQPYSEEKTASVQNGKNRVQIYSIGSISGSASVRVFSPEGNILFDEPFDAAHGEIRGFICAANNGKYGILNDEGKQVVDFEFDSIQYIGEGFWAVRDHDNYGIFNPETGLRTELEFTKLGNMNESLFPARKNFWGVVNNTGNTVVDYRYSGMGDKVICGMVPVSFDSKYGVIDMQGKEIVPLTEKIHSLPEILPNGLIIANIEDGAEGDSKCVIYDRTGKACQTYGELKKWEKVTSELVRIYSEGQAGCILNSMGDVVYDLKDRIGTVMGESFSFYPITFDGEWMLIGPHISAPDSVFLSLGDGELSGKCNYINLNFELKYSEPFEGTICGISDDGRTLVVRTDEQTVSVISKDTVCTIDNRRITNSSDSTLGYVSLVFDRYVCAYYWIYDIETESIYNVNPKIIKEPWTRYIDIDEIPPRDEEDIVALIVKKDGYYGLITEKGLAGDGISYLSVGMNENRLEGTVLYGSDSITFYVSPDGTVIRKNADGSYTVVPCSPLTGGEKMIPAPITLKGQTPVQVAVTESPASEEAEQNETGIQEQQPVTHTETQSDAAEAEGTANIGTEMLQASDAGSGTFESYLASTTIDQVNVRKNPDRKSELINRLDEIGTPVTVIGETYDETGQKWFLVELRSGKQGYVRSNLIGEYDPEFEARKAAKENTPTPEPADTPEPVEQPQPESEEETTKEAAEPEPVAEENTAEKKADGKITYPVPGKTNIQKVNIRVKPDKKGRRITYIVNEGTPVQVLDKKKDSDGDEWYRIKINKTTGYVLASMIDLISEEEAKSAETEEKDRFPFQAQTTKKKVNMRQKPDPNSRRVTYIKKKGTVVTVLDELVGKDKEIWYHIKLSDNQTGYALKAYFEQVTSGD